MSSIIIDEISTHETTLECSVRSAADLERFFTDESFRTSYDVPIGDVPEGVLAIPVLAQVCPVAWANGADVYVDEVDATFARALEDVKESLCDMHDFLEGDALRAPNYRTGTGLDRRERPAVHRRRRLDVLVRPPPRGVADADQRPRLDDHPGRRG